MPGTIKDSKGRASGCSGSSNLSVEPIKGIYGGDNYV